jgi:hypothetical protein
MDPTQRPVRKAVLENADNGKQSTGLISTAEAQTPNTKAIRFISTALKQQGRPMPENWVPHCVTLYTPNEKQCFVDAAAALGTCGQGETVKDLTTPNGKMRLCYRIDEDKFEELTREAAASAASAGTSLPHAAEAAGGAAAAAAAAAAGSKGGRSTASSSSAAEPTIEATAEAAAAGASGAVAPAAVAAANCSLPAKAPGIKLMHR